MDIEISDVWKIMKRRFLMILAFIIVSLTATGLISFYLIQPEYEGTAKLLIQSQNTNNQNVYDDVETNQNLITTYGEIIKSNRIAEDVINRLSLNITSKELLEQVKVHATEESLITSVTVRDHDPDRAVAIANGFAQSFYNNLDAIMKVDNVSILDEAKLPANPIPVRPKPYLNMSVAFVLTLVVGVCLALLMEFLDRTVKTEENIEELLGLPVLGVVVHFNGKKKKKKAKRKKKEQLGGTIIENKGDSGQVILP